MKIAPGFYSHYKGGLYFVFGTSRYSEDPSQPLVVYYSLHFWEWWTRPAHMWFDVIPLRDGLTTTRFKKVNLWYALTNLRK